MNNSNNTSNITSSSSSRTSQQHHQQQACAACKNQRRKCGPNCILAPYFPHDHQKQFLNAHKLFGVGKISSMIKPLSPIDRDMAVKTIIFQSDMRAYDPAGGCYRLIQQLQSQIEYHTAELQLVLQQLAMFRAQAQSHQDLLDPLPIATTCDNAYANNNNNNNNNFDDDVDPLTLYTPGNVVAADNNNLMAHQQFLQQNQHEDLNTWIMLQNSMTLLSPLVVGTNNENGNTRLVVDNNDYVGYDQKPMSETLESNK